MSGPFLNVKLKALAFIHDLNIAHRVSTLLILYPNSRIPIRYCQDAFRDNFVVQWHPESLRTMKVSFTRPRVYLIDFEVAVQFPIECPETERLSIGLPLGGSFTDPEQYARPHAPECASGIHYSPFKLDVWQLGISFSDFKVRCSLHIFVLFLNGSLRAPLPQSTRSWWV